MMKVRNLLLSFMAALALPAAVQAQQPQAAAAEEAPAGPAVYDAQIIATYPHDANAFTQGLLWHDGALYESTGQEGESEVRRVTLETGEIEQSQPIPTEQFGEGLALWGDELVSLTWMDREVHRWDVATLEHRATQEFPFEGWGLTYDGTSLIASDGSSVLRFLDPETLEVQRELTVTLGGDEVIRLNELEWIDGMVFANVWFTGFLLGIDPVDGVVQQVVDLRPLVPANRQGRNDAVLNGIAHDPESGRLFVTGKLWPNLYEIRLVERVGATAAAAR
ncbi:glutaminyl-peptide cyclotransferase [Aurantiacibacter gilvus]|uniref:Glutaminyl-peptide cyclotransferase n=1 Tax=Aurantiacibacter gilvus TaxID=3139141 RepID=A0ABU9IBL7_9SPHN